MEQYIPKEIVQKEGWKYYFVLFAWPIYIFLLGFVYSKFKYFSVLFMIFPGAYLFTWTACLMHECWHKYVSVINNSIFYNLFSYLLLTDPQIYRLIHGHHHSNVNMWKDFEFHPLGKINNIYLRRVYNFFEIILGSIFVVGVQMQQLGRHEDYKIKYKMSSCLISIIMWVVIYGGLISLSVLAFEVEIFHMVVLLLMALWMGSAFVHHIQLIEHGNLIVEGDFHERKVRTRNLKDEGFFAKLFLFLTHGDAREHVLHHTHVGVYSRPFPRKVPMPEESVRIGLSEYFSILWAMVTKG